MKKILSQKNQYTGIVHVSSLSGHRESYLNLFADKLKMSKSSGAILGASFIKLCSTEKLLFATIDDDYIGFSIISMIRSFFGLRTVGLFLRPKQCFLTNKLVYKAKKKLFQGLVKIPRLTVISIIPYDLCPRYSEISNKWIHDPQLWDIGSEENYQSTGFISVLDEFDKVDKKVLSFIGTVNKIKGFMFLYDIVKNNPEITITHTIIIAGKVNEECRAEVEELKNYGVVVINRYLTDDEISELYDLSDTIWCCYHPTYDQASGIYGRAFQKNKKPIVRQGSLIEQYKKYTMTDHVVLEYGNSRSAYKVLNSNVVKDKSKCFRKSINSELIKNWDKSSIELIENCL